MTIESTITPEGVMEEVEREMTDADREHLKQTEGQIGGVERFRRGMRHPGYSEAMRHPSPAVRHFIDQQIDRLEEAERIREIIRETLGDRQPGSAALEPMERALALLIAHPECDTVIAEQVPCPRTQLYRWERYTDARKVLRSGRQDLPKGRIENETLDAWEDAREDD